MDHVCSDGHARTSMRFVLVKCVNAEQLFMKRMMFVVSTANFSHKS